MHASSKTIPPPALYQPMPVALFRAPLFSTNQLVAFSAIRGRWSLDDTQRADREADEGVKRLLEQFRLALLVGSKSLYEAWERELRTGAVSESVARKLGRFLVRMSSRPTPYGLFAGVSLTDFANCTKIEFDSPREFRRTRPDMGWLLQFASKLESRIDIRRQLRLVQNPSIMLIGNRFVLKGWDTQGEGDNTVEVSVAATALIRLVLSHCASPIDYESLCAALVSATHAGREQVERLVFQMWERALLLSDLVPTLATSDPMDAILSRIASISAAESERDQLSRLRSCLRAWDSLPEADALHSLRTITNQMKGLVDKPSDHIVQSDMGLNLKSGTIHQTVGYEAARAAELLLRLSPFPDGPPRIAEMRRVFVERYNEGREVPLLSLLEPGSGIGPYVNDQDQHDQPLMLPALAQRSAVLLNIAGTSLRSVAPLVEMDESLLHDLQSPALTRESIPPSIDLYAQVLASSAEEIDAGKFMLLVGPNVGAIGAGRNLSRFSTLLGPRARQTLESSIGCAFGLSSDEIAAEIVYTPKKARLANVAVRPALLPYAIHFGGYTPPPGVTAISPADLVVGVRHNKFYIRSKKFGKIVRIIPTHLLNSIHAPDACRFLTDVGLDGQVQLFGFNWGPAERLPYLPRVQSGRVILRPAEWKISTETRRYDLPSTSISLFLRDLSKWRSCWNLPRFVYLTDADNRLLIDLDDPDQVAALHRDIQHVESSRPLILQEALPSFDHAWVQGPLGHYFSEFVVSLQLRNGDDERGGMRSPPSRESIGHSRASTIPTADSLKMPGSEWLFLKLYVSLEGQVDLLHEHLQPFCEHAIGAGHFDRFFFIRYRDPQPHIRVRFYGQPSQLLSNLFPSLCAWATDLERRGLCSAFSFDTYDREVERYGGLPGIDLAESIFCADSRSVLQYLAFVHLKVASVDIEDLAVATIDTLLTGLGLPQPERTAWLRDLVSWRASVGTQYRTRQATLRSLLQFARTGHGCFPPLLYSIVQSARIHSHFGRQTAIPESVLSPFTALSADYWQSCAYALQPTSWY